MSPISTVLPEIKEIIGALLFASKEPVTVSQISRVLQATGEAEKGGAADFAQLTPKDIEKAVREYQSDIGKQNFGFIVSEIAKGFRLENKSNCGPWLRELLNKSKANRLSQPALETLAIIAYRQPATRSEIEAVRGVAVDAIVKNLLELQLIKVVGRSDMPGRPWLFGTTQQFLLHFGIRDITDLPNIEELKKATEEARKKTEAEAKSKNSESESDSEEDEDEDESEAIEENVEPDEKPSGEVAESSEEDDEDEEDDEVDDDEDEFDDDDDEDDG